MQERATTAIFLIHSMIETFRPFLIITTNDSLSRWEADFERLVPSVDVVVYSGNSDTREIIRASEFFDRGCMVVQVLVSSVETVLEVWRTLCYSNSCLDVSELPCDWSLGVLEMSLFSDVSLVDSHRNGYKAVCDFFI